MLTKHLFQLLHSFRLYFHFLDSYRIKDKHIFIDFHDFSVFKPCSQAIFQSLHRHEIKFAFFTQTHRLDDLKSCQRRELLVVFVVLVVSKLSVRGAIFVRVVNNKR